MKHYWINIDKNEKRRKFMSDQFEKLNIDNYRISAITPNDFDNVLEEKLPLKCGYPGCKTCDYEYACLCSHIKAMQEGIKTGDDYFIIMEDDIKISFIIDYDNLILNIPKDTEILQMIILYGDTVESLYSYWIKTGVKYIRWRYLLPSTGMYMISRKGAEKLINMFYNTLTKKYYFEKSIYQKVADVLLYESAITYATTVPYCVPFIEMGSDIHPDHLDSHSNAIKSIEKIINMNSINRFPCIVRKI